MESAALWRSALPGWSRAAYASWTLGLAAAWLAAQWIRPERESRGGIQNKAVKEGLEENSITPHLSQLQGQIFDSQKYLQESVRAMFEALGQGHPAFNSLILWWQQENALCLDQSWMRQGRAVESCRVLEGE